MANTTTGGYENKISSIIQRGVALRSNFRQLASFREEGELAFGKSVNRPTMTDLGVIPTESYVANTAITATAWTLTQELMTVNNQRAARVQVDPTEIKDITANINLLSHISKKLTDNVTNLLDRDFMDEYSNAANSIDASDFGGSASSPIDLTTTPIEQVIGLAAQELDANPFRNVSASKYLMIDPFMKNKIENRGLAITYNNSDKIFYNGFTGMEFMGCKLFMADLPWTITLTLTDVAVADNTFTIDGVTCTAKATPSAAGEFDVEASATAQGDTIAALINGSGTPGADTYIELSQENRDTWDSYGMTATNAAGVVTITGYGRVTFSETLTNGSFGSLQMKYKVGNIGDVDMVAQLKPYLKPAESVKNFGKVLKGLTLWGTKTFSDGVQNGCSILIKG